MASTVVYQSYFESQHFEPRALRLKLSSPNNIPLKSHSIDSSITPQDNTITTNATSLSSPNPNSNSNSRSWSFLESLSNLSSNDDKDQKKTLLSYIQPPSSRRTLSDESLALCTESLGSETGSDVMNDQDLFLVSSDETERRTSSTTSRTSKRDKKMNVIASLPPPLTSMRGVDCIQVKSHRENGRLVMMATKPPPRNRCLQDRSNGCVRLAILIDSNELIETETKEEIQEYKEEDDVEVEVEVEEEEEEDIEVKGLKKIERSRRCHGENRVFLNMESLCVATS